MSRQIKIRVSLSIGLLAGWLIMNGLVNLQQFQQLYEADPFRELVWKIAAFLIPASAVAGVVALFLDWIEALFNR